MSKTKKVEFLDIFRTFADAMSPPNISADMFPKFDPLPGFGATDPLGLVGKSQKQLEALKKANESTAEIVRAHSMRQSQIFNDLMQAAQDHAKRLETPLSPESQQKNLEVYTQAYDKAVELMQVMAEETRVASEEVFQKVSAQARDTIDEIKAK